MNRKQKKMLIRILAAAAMLIALHFIPADGILRLAFYLAVYLIIGYDILKKAGKGILNRQVFDENFLMAIATVGAFALAIYERSGDYNEAIAVMLFYQIGEWFQSYAVGKSRRNISALMDIRPDYANIERGGALERVDPDEVAIGSIIVVQPGEKIPIDGVILSGASSLNTSALTGESLPRDVKEGDAVISGCINMTGLLHIRTTKEFDGRFKNQNNEGLWGIYRLENFGIGRKLQLPQVQIGEFYFQICKNLYAGGLSRRSGSGHSAACDPDAVSAERAGMGRMDLQGTYISCNQLSLRSGD